METQDFYERDEMPGGLIANLVLLKKSVNSGAVLAI